MIQPDRLSRRELIAYHEAGHAVVGHHQGLTIDVIYVDDVGGQVLFGAQWSADEVLQDPDLLDRYALMLLASAYVERRCVGAVVGAESDIATMEQMIGVAEQHGIEPRADLWERAERAVAEHWAEISALAEELVHRPTPGTGAVRAAAPGPETSG